MIRGGSPLRNPEIRRKIAAMGHEGNNRLEIRAVLFQEIGWWVAQCLEYDIAVQARTVEALLHELERVLVGYILLGQKKGRLPFQGMPSAPQRYREMYERAKPVEKDLPSFAAAPSLPEIELLARAA